MSDKTVSQKTGTTLFVSDGEPSLKPILRNFRDTEENRTSSRIIAILQRLFGVTITHFFDCAKNRKKDKFRLL